MKPTLTALLLFLLQFAGAQTGLIAIPGTKCSMVPPPGFTAATAFNGFQNSEGASIMVNEIPAPYRQLADGFTAEALKSRGMTLIKKEEIDFNNAKATLIYVSQPANDIIYSKITLMFGTTETVILNGIYPEEQKSLEAGIKKALLTTVYNPSKETNPLEAATFTLSTDGTAFKPVMNMSGTVTYTENGSATTPQKTTFTVGNSFSKINPQDRKQYAEQRLKKLPHGEFAVIETVTKITIDGMEGYEIIAKSKTREGKPNLLYQVMLFNTSGDYFMILGQSESDWEKYTAQFKKMALTFKRK